MKGLRQRKRREKQARLILDKINTLYKLLLDEQKELIPENPKPIVKPEEQEKTTLEKETMATVTKNKKELLKEKICTVATQIKVTVKDMKIRFVDEEKHVSKATFYRYLQELREEKRIELLIINEQEYICPIQIGQSL